MKTHFANPDVYAADGRGVSYSMAYFSASHPIEDHYLMTIVGKDGHSLVGTRAGPTTKAGSIP